MVWVTVWGAVAGSLSSAAADWEFDAGPQGLSPSWTAACLVAAESPQWFCLPEQGAPALERYSTFAMKVLEPAAEDLRVQLISDTEKTGSLIFAASPREEVCMTRAKAEGYQPIGCGHLLPRDPTPSCGSQALETGRVLAKTCRLRPVPYDNSDFPRFPTLDDASYLMPWSVYATDGGDVPGDLDRWFFENVAPQRLGLSGVLTLPQRRALDILAWQEFLAIHWPVDPGEASTRQPFQSSAPSTDRLCPAWSDWRRPQEVISADPRTPLAWEANPIDGAHGDTCKAFDTSKLPQLSSSGVSPEVTHRQADQCILWDADGLPVFYDVRINRPIFQKILEGGYYRGAGPADSFFFPTGTFYVRGSDTQAGIAKAPPEEQGPVAIKTAWKLLTDAHDLRRFVLARHTFSSPPNLGAMMHETVPEHCTAKADPDVTSFPSPDSPASCREALGCKLEDDGNCACLFGLVAMHVAHKTSNNPKWNWATFMHRDALAGEDPEKQPAKPLFANDRCEDGQYKSVSWLERTGKIRTQICAPLDRAVDEDAEAPAAPSKLASSTEALNSQMEAMLASSKIEMWQRLSHYRLLGNQWTVGADLGYTNPQSLLNPLMETFDLHKTGESCLGCHQDAGWEGQKKVPSDFMFFLPLLQEEAQKPSGQQ